MDKVSVTLLLCIGGEFWLIRSAVKGCRRKNWDEPLQKYVDYFGVFIGIPLFVITLFGLINSL